MPVKQNIHREMQRYPFPLEYGKTSIRVYAGSFAKGQEGEVITAFPFTCNLQQMHITLSEVRSINCTHTITIYQQGCQVEQIPRLELVMMSSNT